MNVHYVRIGDTDEFNLEKLGERLESVYPGNLSMFRGLPSNIYEIICTKGFNVRVEDGDQYDKCQWLKVEDDFELPELNKVLEAQIDDMRVKYANELANDLIDPEIDYYIFDKIEKDGSSYWGKWNGCTVEVYPCDGTPEWELIEDGFVKCDAPGWNETMLVKKSDCKC